MLDYNTLNSLVEAFKKNGIKNIELESGSTIEVKEGKLLVDGSQVGGADYKAGAGIVIDDDLSDNSKVIMVDQDVIPFKSDIKKLYQHSISFKSSATSTFQFYVTIIIINNSITPFTIDTLVNFTVEKGYSSAFYKNVYGYVYDQSRLGIITGYARIASIGRFQYQYNTSSLIVEGTTPNLSSEWIQSFNDDVLEIN